MNKRQLWPHCATRSLTDGRAKVDAAKAVRSACAPGRVARHRQAPPSLGVCPGHPPFPRKSANQEHTRLRKVKIIQSDRLHVLATRPEEQAGRRSQEPGSPTISIEPLTLPPAPATSLRSTCTIRSASARAADLCGCKLGRFLELSTIAQDVGPTKARRRHHRQPWTDAIL